MKKTASWVKDWNFGILESWNKKKQFVCGMRAICFFNDDNDNLFAKRKR